MINMEQNFNPDTGDDAESQEARVLEKLPLIEQWIDATIEQYHEQAVSVESFGFKHLKDFYSDDLLHNSKVVVVDEVPKPPLASEFGLVDLQGFEDLNAQGITYKDTYFVSTLESKAESLHFHELVHIVQWQYLNAENFLGEYAKSLLRDGYSGSVFEIMARKHQERFNAYLAGDNDAIPYNIEIAVQDELKELFPDLV